MQTLYYVDKGSPQFSVFSPQGKKPQISWIITDFFHCCHSRGGGNPEGHFQPLKTRKYTEKVGSGVFAARELQRTARVSQTRG